nr:hypothetical protein CFP56_07492 [Quercus suber]
MSGSKVPVNKCSQLSIALYSCAALDAGSKMDSSATSTNAHIPGIDHHPNIPHNFTKALPIRSGFTSQALNMANTKHPNASGNADKRSSWLFVGYGANAEVLLRRSLAGAYSSFILLP